jgi:lantibiotic biosynthesis protein
MKWKEDLNSILTYMDTKLGEEQYQNYSLYNGMPGLTLCYYYLAKYTGEKKFADKAATFYESINTGLESGTVNFRIFHSLSYGITGIAYTHWHLNEFGLRSTHPADFEGIEEMLLPCCEDDFNRSNTDNLHGPLGVFYYLSKVMHTSPDVPVVMEKLLERYAASAIIDEWGMRIKNNSVKEVHETEYNMSLSHGLCGNLLIFAEAYANGFRSEKMMQLIRDGLKYINNTEKPVLDRSINNSHFPSFFSEHAGFDKAVNTDNYNTRLAWCYGDLNMALLFIRLGQVLKDTALVDRGIHTAERSLWRKTRMEAQVADVFFCHGASGLAYLYLKLYHLTGREAFLHQTDHWMDITSERLKYALDNGNEENPFSLLEGYPGVAMVYLSRMQGKPLPWDDTFLLNF